MKSSLVRNTSFYGGLLRLLGLAVFTISSISSPEARAQGGPPRARKGLPAELMGEWEVERVLADLADQPHWGIHPDDPSLLYRTMSIAPSSIRLAGLDRPCTQSSWTPLITSWQTLFKKSGLARANGEGADEIATPADYDLPVGAGERVHAYLVCPRNQGAGAKAWRGAGWMALHGQDRLVVRHSEQNLLLLRRRPAGQAPRASFACDQAGSATEQAICSSAELAAWDRSVAEALRQALERQAETTTRAALIKSQVTWKAQRDRCGAQAACVDEALWRRVEELMQK